MRRPSFQQSRLSINELETVRGSFHLRFTIKQVSIIFVTLFKLSMGHTALAHLNFGLDDL